MSMTRPGLVALLVGATAAFIGMTPLAAQIGPVDPATTTSDTHRPVLLGGGAGCPSSGDRDDIVVCAHRQPGERFRIPKDLREAERAPSNDSWATRSEADEHVGAGGVGSCSTVGASGSTGCTARAGQQFKREKQAAAADQRAIDETLP